LIERIIENWLINSTERIYQVPFCQILGLKGYKVLHLSAHGVSEHGKDIIAIDNKNIPCAFQLKTGDINSFVWRQIHGEITELVELPIEHPSIDSSKKHRAILVTNGKITDDVRTKITSLNRGYRRRGLPKLELITGKELLQDFICAQGSFLPNDPQEIQDFLELYLSDGRMNLEEEKFANFIKGILFGNEQKSKNTTLLRKIASALLLTKYSLNPYEKANNYISIIKGWVIFCSYILALVEKTNLPKKYWLSSYRLCWHEIDDCLKEFKEEVIQRNNIFLEGDLTGDGGIVYRTRTTIILGWLSAYELLQKYRDSSYRLDRNVYELIKDNFPHNMFLWGESASIYFIMMGLFLSFLGEKELSANIYATILSGITRANNLKSKTGLADPYYSPDQILGAIFQLPDIEIDFTSFIGTSYSLKTLIDCLVRENRRDILEKLWYYISYIQYCEYTPEPIWHTYFWRSEKGTEVQKAFDSPQSWKILNKDAFSEPHNIPQKISEDKRFLFLFLLTFPHRVKSDLVKLIDHNFHYSTSGKKDFYYGR